ncbi:MAG: response regulator [Parasulfuritortus sp.]|jgi:two-component system chemotaxis response regulator CheY|nr:response regulator [Parasulfuritortus sp.]
MSLDAKRSLAELRLLLVEPSALQGKVIAGQLQKLGVANVEVVQLGQQALARMREQLPDLVMSAMYLEDMNGTDLILTMRQDSQLSGVPFVLISSETRPNLLEPVRQSGVCGILPKPFSEAQLSASLQATLDWLNPDQGEEEGIDLTGRRVLIVDDSGMARKFMRRVLENLGFEAIVEATNGAEAAGIMDEEMVDLVVTDYNMPEMDGQALIEYIRTRSWQNSVPVIMVTSETNEGRLAAVQGMGVVGVCDKPFEPATVKGLLRSLMN